MFNQKNRELTALLKSTDIVIPTLLGKSFRIENDPNVYQVVGTRWRSQEIVLKEESTEKTLTLPGNDFFKMATRIDE
jgi:hypothetical protein